MTNMVREESCGCAELDKGSGLTDAKVKVELRV